MRHRIAFPAGKLPAPPDVRHTWKTLPQLIRALDLAAVQQRVQLLDVAPRLVGRIFRGLQRGVARTRAVAQRGPGHH